MTPTRPDQIHCTCPTCQDRRRTLEQCICPPGRWNRTCTAHTN